MVGTFADKILNDMLIFGILSAIALWFISKFRKESMKETLEWLKDLVLGGKEENE